MHEPIDPKRKKAKGFFFVLLLLVLGGGGWFYLKERSQPLEPIAVSLVRYQEQRPLMGTLAAITVYAESQEKADSAFALAFGRAEAIDQVASDYLPDSELTAFNGLAANTWHPASSDFRAMVTYGLELAEITGGAYDPTLGTMTHLWRETRKAGRLPTAATLDGALANAGWEFVEIDEEQGRIRKLRDDLRLDLGGLGKGYAADQMLNSLQASGIQSALVAVGGDVRCGSPPPNKSGWTVGLKNTGNEVATTISISDCAVSTSGDLEQFIDIEGRRYSHILDPASGLGLNDSLLATVVAPNGLMADTLATAACVNPTYFKRLLPETKIHSQILSKEQSQVSLGFPLQSPFIAEDTLGQGQPRS